MVVSLRFSHIIPRPHSHTLFYYLSFRTWLHGVLWDLAADASAPSPTALAPGMLGVYDWVGRLSQSLWSRLWHVMASRDCYTLIFSSKLVSGRLSLLLPGFTHLSSSSSWPSHVRKAPSCRFLVGMLTINQSMASPLFLLSPVTKMPERCVSHLCT
jgi:hypothetical protein